MVPRCSNVPKRPRQAGRQALQAVVGQVQGSQVGIVAELAVKIL